MRFIKLSKLLFFPIFLTLGYLSLQQILPKQELKAETGHGDHPIEGRNMKVMVGDGKGTGTIGRSHIINHNRKGLKPFCDGCFTWDALIIRKPATNFCTSTKGSKRIDLMIIVTSRHQNRHHRDVMRQVYNNDIITSNKTKLLFTFGKEAYSNETEEELLVKESENYRDIIQFDFKGSYRNLTRLTLNTYKWIIKDCGDTVRYVVKITDDVFVNTKVVLQTINDKHLSDRLSKVVFGYCWDRTIIVRSKSNKYYTSYIDYPFKFYPLHCSASFLFSHLDILRRIVPASRNIAYTSKHDGVDVGQAQVLTGDRVCRVPGMFNTGKIKGKIGCHKLKGKFVYAVHLHGHPPEAMSQLFSCRKQFTAVQNSFYNVPCIRNLKKGKITFDVSLNK